jgi:serine/threonine protein kinase
MNQFLVQALIPGQRYLVLKVIPEAFAHDPERLSRFQREAKMLAALNHPNIATIHGLERSNGSAKAVTCERFQFQGGSKRPSTSGQRPQTSRLGGCFDV